LNNTSNAYDTNCCFFSLSQLACDVLIRNVDIGQNMELCKLQSQRWTQVALTLVLSQNSAIPCWSKNWRMAYHCSSRLSKRRCIIVHRPSINFM